MTTTPSATPPNPALARQSTATDSPSASVADWARSALAEPGRLAAILPGSTAIAVALVVPLRHWTTLSLLLLLTVVGVAGTSAALRATIGARFPLWSLHVDVAMGTLGASLVTGIANAEDIDLSNLYIMIVVFVTLFLQPRVALAHVASAAAAYAVVLAIKPMPGETPGLEWLSVFGTATILGAFMLGLVSVLRSTALRDPLTGLPNRRSWDERLEEEMRRSQRTGATLAVAIIDLDGFKAVNDRDGHEAGDMVLRTLTHAWKADVRSGGDFVARIGGDEFALLALDSDTAGINRLLERLHDVSPEGVPWSAGVSTWDGTERPQELLRRADQAMYQAKQRRRHDQAVMGPASSR